MGPTKEELLKSLPIPGTTVILAGHCLMASYIQGSVCPFCSVEAFTQLGVFVLLICLCLMLSGLEF